MCVCCLFRTISSFPDTDEQQPCLIALHQDSSCWWLMLNSQQTASRCMNNRRRTRMAVTETRLVWTSGTDQPAEVTALRSDVRHQQKDETISVLASGIRQKLCALRNASPCRSAEQPRPRSTTTFLCPPLWSRGTRQGLCGQNHEDRPRSAATSCRLRRCVS